MFIPAILSILPKAKPILNLKDEEKRRKGVLNKVLRALASGIAKRPKTIIAGFLVFALAVGLGALFIVVDTNPLSFYQKEAPIWRSTRVLNENLGGWAGISVVVEGDIKSPEVMRQIDALETHLKKHPLVGNTTSIAKFVRKMHQSMNGGDPKFDKIPDRRDLIAQYFLLYSMSADPEDFNKIVDFEYKNSQVIAQVKDSGTSAATEVVSYTNAYLAKQKKGPFKLVGGFLDVMANLVAHVVYGQLSSLFLAVIICSLLVGILMRSVVAGVISMLPLGVAISLLFGVMGYFGIELNLITAMLSSIMVGVGIDYTIHFLWRYRDERRESRDPVEAMTRTLTTTGRGIVFNALSVVIGFVVLLISAFFPVKFFGILVVVSITACLVCALVLLPAVVIVFRPKFLEPKGE
jgi:predicted RND superfamily exporter protein